MIMELTDKVTEENVLSLLLYGGKTLVSDVFGNISPDDFYFKGYRKLFLLMYECYMNGEELSTFSLMKRHGAAIAEIVKECDKGLATLESVNVVSLIGNTDDAVGALAYRLKEKHKMRDLYDVANRIIKGLDASEETEKTYKAVESLLLSHSTTAKRSYMSPSDMAMLMVSYMSERMDADKLKNEVMFTSYEQLNKASGGFEKGNLIILSAGSGVGKSALSINIARDIAYVGNKTVLYLNSEMTDKQQAGRYAALLAGVSHMAIRNGKVDDKEFNAVTKCAEKFKTKKIHTVTFPDMQLANVVTEIKRMKAKEDVDFVVVDYIGRMDITKSFGKDLQEWQIMEQTARELKNLALEMDVVIVMVAQMSSNGQTLAKASSMKNECDLWMNLKRITKEDYKDFYDENDVGLDKCWNVLIEFKKARSAKFGAKIPMYFYGDWLLFTDDIEKAQHFARLESAECGL